MKYGAIKKYDIANGPGLRISLFVSGCTHKCKGCFNEELWNKDYGEVYNEKTEKEILDFLSSEYVSGLTILGGDPFCFNNYEALIPLVKKIKESYPNKTIWVYTGNTIDIITNEAWKCFSLRVFLKHIDVIVDGPFIEELKDPSLEFRGSSNQNIIHGPFLQIDPTTISLPKFEGIEKRYLLDPESGNPIFNECNIL